MSKKNKAGDAKFRFSSEAVNLMTPAAEVKVSAPPPNKWSAMFKCRAAKIQMYSYLDDRDQALVEMTVLLHQYLQEPYGIRLEGMIRL